MARLVLIRHAKADHPAGVRDLDRPLAVRGRSDAVAAARWLRLHAESWPLPMLTLVSPAARAQQTFEPLDSALPAHERRDDISIYDAAASTLHDLVRMQGDDLGTLVLVGHNPGMHTLADELAAERIERFSPGTIAILDAPGWSTGPGQWTLHDLHVPRG